MLVSGRFIPVSLHRSLTNAGSARLPANLSVAPPAPNARQPLATARRHGNGGKDRHSIALVIPCDPNIGRMSYVAQSNSDESNDSDEVRSCVGSARIEEG
jgi:hypothetical protein